MEIFWRWQAVGLIEAGQSITDIALFFGVRHSVISRLWKQFQTSQTVVRIPVAGRPRVTNPSEDRYIAVVAKRNRRSTFTRVTSMVASAIGKTISATTVRRRLHMNGLYARVPRVCVPLSVQARGARLKWCRQHVNWTVSDWGNVMFTDESRFALQPDDKRVRVWREQGTRNRPENITEHHAFRGGSIIVWAGRDFIGISHKPVHLQARFCDGCPVSRWSPRPHCETVHKLPCRRNGDYWTLQWLITS